MVLKETRHTRPAELVSVNHPRVARIITEFGAFAEISVEVMDDLTFEVYVCDLGQRVYLREFRQDPDAVARDPKRAERLVPRFIPGDLYAGYEFPLVHRNSSGSDEPLMDGIFVVRKGAEDASGPEGMYRALRLDPPTGRSLAEALLTFMEEDEEERERQAEQARRYFAEQKAKYRAKVPPLAQPCGCAETCMHGEYDCSSCEYKGGHAYAYPTRQPQDVGA